MVVHAPCSEGERCAEILTRVHLPLENLEFTIDSYLLDNAVLLDKQTRTMLIGVRENVHRLALTSRTLAAPLVGAAELEGPDMLDPANEVLAAGN